MFASKSDVDGKVSKASIITEINNAGSEVKIDADKITLTAEMIEATNFSVKKLNTTGTGYKNNIVIENNQLNAYNGNSLPSLTVSGDSFEKIIPGLNIKTINGFSDSNSSGMTNEQEVMSFTFLKDQNYCEIIIGDIGYYCECMSNPTYPLTSGTYGIYGTLKYNLYKGSTLITTLKSVSVSYEITDGMDSTGNGPTSNYFKGNPISIGEINYSLGKMTEDTTYTLKVKVDLTWQCKSGSGQKQMWGLGFSKSVNIMTRYAIERTDIAQNGFRTAFDSSHFVEFSNFNGNSNIMMYSKNAGIRISDENVYIKINGVWYQLINSSGTLRLTERTEQHVLSQYGKPSNGGSY